MGNCFPIFKTARKEEQNMIKSGKLYSSIAIIILSGIYLSALFAGNFALDTFSPLISFVSFLLLLLCARGFRDLIFPAIVYILLFASTASISVAAAWICVFAAISIGSLVITLGEKIHRAMVILTAPMVYGASLALTGNPLISLVSLVPYPAMLFLGFCTAKTVNRKTTLICTSFGLGISSALLIFVSMVKYSVSLDGLKESIEWIKNSVIKYMSEYTVNTPEGATNLFADAEYIKEYIDGLVNIIPGTAIVLLISVAFVMQLFIFSALKKEKRIEFLISDATDMEISGLCAGIYLLAFVLSFTTNSEGKLMLGSIVMQNIYLALTPALAYVSVSGINGFFKKRRMRPGLLLIIPAVFLLMYGLLSVALAFLGATIIIVSKAKKYADDPK